MAEARPILRVGLTGGIASGKTTVARLFDELGACVIDADQLARLVTAPGSSAHSQIVARFGEEILQDDGAIDRELLARLVFSDPDARQALDSIVHPEVRAEASRRFELCAAERDSGVAIFDAALLVETGYYRELDRLVVLRCSTRTQLRRLERRDGFSPAEAVARISAQAPLDRKLAVANYVIDTDLALERTRAQTERVWNDLLRDRDRLFGG